MTQRAIMVFCAALAAPALAGCGFTPLYATPGLSHGLAGVDVVAPEGRVGYLLREALDDDLGRDKDADPAWRLTLALDQSRDPRGLTINNFAQRYQVGLTIAYSLTDIASGEVVHTGRVITQVSYDAANDPYAGIAARQDSQQRAAADAARRIELDLAAWMARRRTTAP
ncbi:MAG TPA: LPS assembly lipoprotein LptE [Caulobacteraceae bacterium]|jgi:LPS-assembly lipoprotein|nr:LPS assembly lipoprotein LptE [Caulobacteraceae bacterium]